MSPVQVDWLSVVFAPVIMISLGLAFVAARRKSAREEGGPRLPTWGRVAQGIGVFSALFVGFIHVLWGG